MRLLSSTTWVFLFLVLVQVSNSIWVQGQCLKDQETLLVQFNQSLVSTSPSPSLKRSSWSSSTDCCSSWDGVTCDRNGRVTGLDLSNESINDGLNSSGGLFKLMHLEKLNLAFNSFTTTPLPSAFGKLKRLTYLNLSNSGLNGQIPVSFSRLTRLVTLDLSCIETISEGLILTDPDLETLIRNLTGLTQLVLDGVYISDKSKKWSRTIPAYLPKLQVLSLSFCSLSGPLDSSMSQLQSLTTLQLSDNDLSTEIPGFLGDFPDLSFLDLSYCELYGEFPRKILNIRTLQILNLQNNKRLQGSLPEFREDGLLQELVLSGTSFSGELPYSIGNLRFLTNLNLFDSGFSGSLPVSISNLNQLQYLELESNSFTGLIPPISCENLISLENGFTGLNPATGWSKSLERISISSNSLSGPIHPEWITLPKLSTLDLSNNSLNGTIPPALFSLPSLVDLSLSNNQFTGHLGEFSNGSSSSLEYLDLGDNQLQGPLPESVLELSKLYTLILGSNNFSGTTLEMLLHKLSNLKVLDISGTGFSIDGTNADYASFPQIDDLKLSSCKLKQIPIFLKNQSSLQDLDLSDNQIHGRIPNWIWKIGDGNLGTLNLSNNFLEDPARPLPINSFQYVEYLDMHSNMLQGKNPILPSLGVQFLDYSSNNFSALIPNISSYLSSCSFFSFSNNQLTGEIPAAICEAVELQILDLSDNKLSGEIPPCLVSMTSLIVLNLRGNNLSGRIPNFCGE